MWQAFFTLGAQSPGRQRAFRWCVAIQAVYLLSLCFLALPGRPGTPQPMLGHFLLVAGIVEGAILLGWRLTQMPKSQALEFLLVSPVRPGRLFIAEALVGLAYLALVTLAGLPVLMLLVVVGYLDALDVAVLTALPWAWGAITGLGLAVWAYESKALRRWGERVLMLLILVYLAVGVLAGEHLGQWLLALPPLLGLPLLEALRASLRYSPFGIMNFWMTTDISSAWPQTLGFTLASLGLVGLLLWRGARRLLPHFHDWHYTPQSEVKEVRPGVGDHPLSWWAVKRVGRYPGRINVYLAGGFCLLYAAYIIAGPSWPRWLGTSIFRICDLSGGVPMLVTMLVLLAAVPAAFQYGLWDSNAGDRLRRLELLLLTDLQPRDYWNAALAAAWARGRDYLAIALVLLLAGCLGGRLDLLDLLAVSAVAVLVWALYFALGFQAFARGHQANGLGLLLTVGMPLGTIVLCQIGRHDVARMLPPGLLFGAGGSASGSPWFWLLGAILAAATTLAATRVALASCDRSLRRWYDDNTGAAVTG